MSYIWRVLIINEKINNCLSAPSVMGHLGVALTLPRGPSLLSGSKSRSVLTSRLAAREKPTNTCCQQKMNTRREITELMA
jgi:hypothetical protein